MHAEESIQTPRVCKAGVGTPGKEVQSSHWVWRSQGPQNQGAQPMSWEGGMPASVLPSQPPPASFVNRAISLFLKARGFTLSLRLVFCKMGVFGVGDLPASECHALGVLGLFVPLLRTVSITVMTPSTFSPRVGGVDIVRKKWKPLAE